MLTLLTTGEAAGASPVAFNSHAEVKRLQIGRGGSAVCRIDDVLLDPVGLAALGYAAQSYAEYRGNLYPGLRAPLPESFSTAFRSWLTPILHRAGLLQPHQAIHRDASFFSVVTTASRDLLPIQRIPHYDSTDPNLFAAVLYLCDQRFCGTSFYRHRRTGYEEITADNQKNYHLALATDMRVHGPPGKEYMNGDSVLFETTFSNELRFNSAIVYPGRLLHAANIPRSFQPPKDKSDWRLTVTALLHST